MGASSKRWEEAKIVFCFCRNSVTEDGRKRDRVLCRLFEKTERRFKVFHVSATFVQSINFQTLFYDMGVCDTVNVLEVLLATSTSSG